MRRLLPAGGRTRVLIPGGLALAAVATAGVLIARAAGGPSTSAEPDTGRSQPPATVSAPPGPRGTSTSPEPADLDGPERELAARLSSFEITGCRGATTEAAAPGGSGDPADPRAAGVQAALRCVPGVAASGAPPADVLVLGYIDEAAVASDAARRAAAIVDGGSCEAGQTSTEAYLLPSRRTGTFVCQAAPGRFAAYWTIDSERVAFVAQSDDPAGLITWWRGFDPL
ncbi:hypothetical protein Franean1_5911 [Parafrankia sp. EAN1pec]|uniref:hypothetical protein n=1 Tax=Parafrankia sp. (strain EAN1pec) TaxID=298653 RepID=UPI00005409B3|nr:hypothetical protein Franean1_5911 [Frankia sp. EAN1pec]